MNAPFERRRDGDDRSAGRNGASLAMSCARNVHQTVDRRSPEASGLAKWFGESAAGFGLSDEVIPGDGDSFGFSRRRGVSEQDWQPDRVRLDRGRGGPAGHGGCADRSLGRGDC